jgi:hypothetical protein
MRCDYGSFSGRRCAAKYSPQMRRARDGLRHRSVRSRLHAWLVRVGFDIGIPNERLGRHLARFVVDDRSDGFDFVHDAGRYDVCCANGKGRDRCQGVGRCRSVGVFGVPCYAAFV